MQEGGILNLTESNTSVTLASLALNDTFNVTTAPPSVIGLLLNLTNGTNSTQITEFVTQITEINQITQIMHITLIAPITDTPDNGSEIVKFLEIGGT